MLGNGRLVGLATLALLVCGSMEDAQASDYVRRHDVIYGRKAGLALTMDVFTPNKGANGIAVIAVASGGWVSGPELIKPIFYQEFLRRGYTVFAVLHGSQPTFTVLDIIEDVERAVRFIRYNAKTYHIDPNRLGILGGSSGGHLALMQGTKGTTATRRRMIPSSECPATFKPSAVFTPRPISSTSAKRATS